MNPEPETLQRLTNFARSKPIVPKELRGKIVERVAHGCAERLARY